MILEFFKKYKFSYLFYNIFQRKKLINNVALYKKYNLSKFYFSPISSKDLSHLPQERTDLFSLNEKNFENVELFNNLTDNSKESVLNFQENGFCILNSYLKDAEVDAINQEITNMIESQKVGFRYRNKIMFSIHYSKLIDSVGKSEPLNKLLDVLLQGKAQLFQSINFLQGSEQATHSDTIHMTTYPLGGLLGVWIALEDTNAENGPLHYYPKSHKMPYLLNESFDNQGTNLMLGSKTYSDYEKMMDAFIKNKNLKKEILLAKKGDLLIWHANLLHGGEPHINKSLTRKSMVFHYFKKDSICYHEITQRPSLIQ